VESGGYHGAKGLEVLAAAAKAAKIENASATDVAHALTGVLNDYRGTGLSTAAATNTLTAAVGHGMMTFQDFAEALPKVGARAAAAHVTFQELTAAMATMTQDGLPATVAATYLGQTIGQLAAPTAKARDEMKGLGINSTELAATITSGSGHGLGDAIEMLYKGITTHLNPAGLVAIENFKKSKATTTDFQKVLANLPPTMQTTVQALAVMAGGVKGFQGLLMLGGKNQEAYNANLAAMNKQVKSGGKDIAGYAAQQKTLNGRLSDAKGAMSAVFDQLGTRLLPVMADWAGKLVPLTDFLMKHSDVIGKVAAAIIVLKATVVAYTAVQWLLNIAMDANPVGLVVLAIEALALGIYTLWTQSKGFRDFMGGFFDNLKVGFYAIELAGIDAFRWLNNAFWSFASVAIHAAAIAFGWVPGLGPKLQDAAAAVDMFKRNSNAALDAIHNDLTVKLHTALAEQQYNALVRNMNQPITIPVFLKTNYTAGTVNVAGVGVVNAGKRAAGGPVDAGQPYWVGEKGPELVVPRSPGHVIDAEKSKAMTSGNGLSDWDIHRLAMALSGVHVQTSISAGALDAAGGRNLR
jgi:TP901 family phage tail tape measure protein